MEAYCLENDIKLLKVDSLEKLEGVFPVNENSNTDAVDCSCILVKAPEKTDHPFILPEKPNFWPAQGNVLKISYRGKPRPGSHILMIYTKTRGNPRQGSRHLCIFICKPPTTKETEVNFYPWQMALSAYSVLETPADGFLGSLDSSLLLRPGPKLPLTLTCHGFGMTFRLFFDLASSDKNMTGMADDDVK
uniref:Uncharacterized protein n=1 Tax=Magallana gigas TaxID=29159 RepID=A0A8W8M2L5_MAGGI